jgi:hypothetical protein
VGCLRSRVLAVSYPGTKSMPVVRGSSKQVESFFLGYALNLRSGAGYRAPLDRVMHATEHSLATSGHRSTTGPPHPSNPAKAYTTSTPLPHLIRTGISYRTPSHMHACEFGNSSSRNDERDAAGDTAAAAPRRQRADRAPAPASPACLFFSSHPPSPLQGASTSHLHPSRILGCAGLVPWVCFRGQGVHTSPGSHQPA